MMLTLRAGNTVDGLRAQNDLVRRRAARLIVVTPMGYRG
jgi:hypothetical protein